MLQRGRKGHLTPVGSTLPVTAIEPPPGLNEEQAEEFSAIVASYPMDWFDSGSVSMLEAMVRHNCEERRLGKLLSEFDTEVLKTPDGMKLYDRLSKNHERQSKAASTLAQKMRLTQLSKYRADKANTLAGKAKAVRPWESTEE
jgi:hypothetical protein